MAKIQLPNSETLGLRILIIDPDDEQGIRMQVRLEEDPDLNRMLFFTTSDIAEAKVWLTKQKMHLAIFPQVVGAKDFVSIQLEILKISPDIQMIPLIDTPTIQQLRESRSIGHVADYGELKALHDFKPLKELIFSFARSSTANNSPMKAALDFAKPLRNALNLSDPNSFEIKMQSAEVLKQLLFHYELEVGEIPQLLAAEYLYSPSMTLEKYQALLTPDPQSLLPTLQSTGSEITGTQAKTLPGFLITASNWFAEKLKAGVTADEMIKTISARPNFLKHVAIRVLTPEIVKQVLGQVTITKVKSG